MGLIDSVKKLGDWFIEKINDEVKRVFKDVLPEEKKAKPKKAKRKKAPIVKIKRKKAYSAKEVAQIVKKAYSKGKRDARAEIKPTKVGKRVAKKKVVKKRARVKKVPWVKKVKKIARVARARRPREYYREPEMPEYEKGYMIRYVFEHYAGKEAIRSASSTGLHTTIEDAYREMREIEEEYRSRGSPSYIVSMQIVEVDETGEREVTQYQEPDFGNVGSFVEKGVDELEKRGVRVRRFIDEAVDKSVEELIPEEAYDEPPPESYEGEEGYRRE